MARFSVHHSTDACCILIRGDKANPEPSTAVIKFPGGHVEVSRCSDGSYWAHIARNVSVRDPDEAADALGVIVDSRVDLTYEGGVSAGAWVHSMERAADVQHIAVRIARAGVGEVAA